MRALLNTRKSNATSIKQSFYLKKKGGDIHVWSWDSNSGTSMKRSLQLSLQGLDPSHTRTPISSMTCRGQESSAPKDFSLHQFLYHPQRESLESPFLEKPEAVSIPTSCLMSLEPKIRSRKYKCKPRFHPLTMMLTLNDHFFWIQRHLPYCIYDRKIHPPTNQWLNQSIHKIERTEQIF